MLTLAAFVALTAGGCASGGSRTPSATARKAGPTAAPSSAPRVPATKAMSIAAIDAACSSFYRLDPGDIADNPTLATGRAYARARLISIDAALRGVDAVPLRKVDEPLRDLVRNNFGKAASIYGQVVALADNTSVLAMRGLLDDAQHLVVTTGAAMIEYGATVCIPSTTSPAVASPPNAGTVVDLAPSAVIPVAKPLLNNDSIAADDHAVWVGVRRGDRVVRIDPSTNVIVATVALDSEIAQPLAVVDGYLWVETATEFVRINESTNRIDWQFSLRGLALPGDDFAVHGDSLWVCNRNVVHQVAISTKSRGTDISAGGGCKGGTLIATDHDLVVSLRTPAHVNVNRFAIATGARTGAVALALQDYWGLAESPDGRVFLDGTRINELDLGRHRVVRSVSRGGGLPGNELAVGGGAVWTTRPAEHRIIRYDMVTGSLEEIVAGAGPIGVAYADDTIWVTNSDDGTVMRFPVLPWPPKA